MHFINITAKLEYNVKLFKKWAKPILNHIYIYPLKSARGIALKRSVPSERRLMFDRRWIVVDTSGKFITQRTNPKMALISPDISTQTLNLNLPGMTQLSLTLSPKVGDLNEIRIWSERCEA